MRNILQYMLDLVARVGSWSYLILFAQRHGPKAVFFGRFIGFARALVPFVAGTSRMRYRQFLIYNAIGAVLWTIGFVTLGYVLGASWQVAEKWIGVVLGCRLTG